MKQAISLFLFSHHEVQDESSSQATDIDALKEYDLLIVDGSALRDRNQLTEEFTRTVQHCGTATLWLEEDESQRPLKREKLLFVKKPIEREKFLSALNSLLSFKTLKKARVGDVASRERKGQKQKEPEFIELLDVVDEQPLPK
ncbi:MAG: hypothetical protein V3W19_07445 [Desulfatiglandales bacterium]